MRKFVTIWFILYILPANVSHCGASCALACSQYDNANFYQVGYVNMLPIVYCSIWRSEKFERTKAKQRINLLFLNNLFVNMSGTLYDFTECHVENFHILINYSKLFSLK